jgi:mannosyltransferase OCH1-like enzyme
MLPDKTFRGLISESYAYDSCAYETSKDWKLLEMLYDMNYQFHPNVMKVDRLPKIIHQIWLGGELPEKYAKFAETWKKFHPDWFYRLWTDKDVESFPFERKDIFDACENVGMKSDVLRYEILNRFGGLYVDTDFECFRPFDDLTYLSFFTGISYDAKVQLYIGLIACSRGNQIIKKCLNSIPYGYTGNVGSKIMEITGANHFTRSFFDVIRKDYSLPVCTFPTQFFYPFPNNLRNEQIDPSSFLKKYSYAIHHWEVSWSKKAKS